MENYYLAMDNMIDLDDRLWFYSFIDNCICCMDKQTLDTEIVFELPMIEGYPATTPRYGKIVEYKRKLFIIPVVMIDIAVYDIDTGELMYIGYPKRELRGIVFSDAIKVGSMLYLIPCEYNSVICIDLEKSEINLYATKDSNIQAWGNALLDGNRILFGCINKEGLYVYDIKGCEIQNHTLCCASPAISGIWKYKERYFIIPQVTDKVIVCDAEMNKYNEIMLSESEYESGEWSVSKTIVLHEKIYMLPRMANKLLIFNMETLKFSLKDLAEKQKINKNNWLDYMPISCAWEHDCDVICAYSKSGQVYNLNNGSHIDIHVNKKTGDGFIRNNRVIHEDDTELFSLRRFVEYLKVC